MSLLVGIALLIATITGLVQWWSFRRPHQTGLLRKGLHLSVILLCAVATDRYPDGQILGGIYVACSMLLFTAVHYRWLNISKGDSWGIALFPLAFGLLLLSEAIQREYVVTATLVLAISDAAAGIVGSTMARRFLVPFLERKSLPGTAVFLISAALIVGLRHPALGYAPVALLCVVLLTTGAEFFSWRGSDNFWIPLVCAIALEGWGRGVVFSTDAALTGLAYCLAGPFFYRRQWLSLEGALAAGYMAYWIAAFLGWQALLFPVFFLLTGSLASKLNEKAPDGTGRTSLQVLANGGPGMLVALFALWDAERALCAYALVFAVAQSDTLSSEIGKYFRGPTVDILRGRAIAPGLSGGISVAGTLAGLLGSALVAALAVGWYAYEMYMGLVIMCLGFVGMLIDSVYGSALQAKYSSTDRLTERGDRARLVRGLHWCNNDVVNVLSILTTLAIYFFTFT
jgi:uncharacterized protein (TIGR00297 family)